MKQEDRVFVDMTNEMHLYGVEAHNSADNCSSITQAALDFLCSSSVGFMKKLNVGVHPNITQINNLSHIILFLSCDLHPNLKFIGGGMDISFGS
ncbi:unnamed protein product [Caenorhabditis brenneri]